MIKRLLPFLCVLFLANSALAPSVCAADPLKKLASKLVKKLEKQTNRKVALLNFPYHNGSLSSGSSIIQERLTTFLAESGKIELIERNLLDKLLGEMKLEQTGVIDAATTKELGKVLGVGAVVTGTLNDLPNNKTEVNARIIETETGRILTAGQAKVERTWTDVPTRPKPPKEVKPPVQGQSLVQMALLLDTSNSMDGLINQAKSQLWKIVNTMASLERDGKNPNVEVALYEYGNNNISVTEGYIRQVLPFTKDLDQISEGLFGLRTNGGQEYAGQVIEHAVRHLRWDDASGVYKVLFIAGNEPFTQGPIDFREATKEAAGRGISLNTIFCGRREEGVSTGWKQGADDGSGEYFNIDQDVQLAAISAPQDREIEELGRKLSDTYIPYGRGGAEAQNLQKRQDVRAAAMAPSGAAVERAVFKSKAQYGGSASWDLATAVENGSMKLEDAKKDQLPAELQQLDKKELKARVASKIEERKTIQRKIETLNADRQKYITEKQKTMSPSAQTLDAAVVSAISKQAAGKNYKLKSLQK